MFVHVSQRSYAVKERLRGNMVCATNSCCWCKKQLRCHLSCDARVNVMNQYAAHLLQNWKDRQFDSALHAMACQTRQAMIAGTDVAAIQQSVIELVRGKVMLVTYCNMLLFCFNVVIGPTHCHQTQS